MTDKELLKQNEDMRQPVECWTRVMGYLRPVSQYNPGKKSEFKERVWFEESASCGCEAKAS
ncbi:MAG: anaerobic ribonucleoside-triphosphate reductase [Lactobacillales bacterium]|jgi:anaerobic ribonucleoside-triphosphate reductase|nr:anaerobic ribonucleoside-triphosphate reductase [Lactobacillales bacterium]